MSVLLAYPLMLVLGILLASGVFLAVSAQPLGRPGPDPTTRIRRLDPDLLRDDEHADSGVASSLAGMLQPLRQDALRLATFLSERLGLGLSPRHVELLDGTDSLADHYLQRLTTPLFYEALALLAAFVFNLLGAWHGLWPAWVWLAVGIIGFTMPHVLARTKLSRHREELVAGLPRLAELLAIAASGGAGIELAAQTVSPYLAGPLGSEWARVGRHVRRGGLTFPEALEELAARNQILELDRLVELLVASYSSGASVAPRLRKLAGDWRQDRLRSLQADAGRAGETMFVPIMLGILVPLIVLVMAPGAAAFVRMLVS